MLFYQFSNLVVSVFHSETAAASRLEDFQELPVLRDRSPLVGERRIEEDRANRGPTTAGKIISDEKIVENFPAAVETSVFHRGTPLPESLDLSSFGMTRVHRDLTILILNLLTPHTHHKPQKRRNKSLFLPACLTELNLSKPLREKMVPR